MPTSAPAFVFMNVTRTAADLDVFARQAARLKRFGRVEVTLGAIASKAFHELPPGGSAWHEYTSIRSALERIVPHPDLRPFVNVNFADANLALLREQAAVLRTHRLGTALGLHAPWIWPEAVFQKHPHLRGPRIDHPRRSRREEFAPCADHPEYHQMLSWMVAAIDREVPALGTIRVWTNDAGGGLCWADWLYPGPNGPAHCRHRGVGPRVRDFVEALRRGVAHGKPDVHLLGNFSEAEEQAVPNYVDDHVFFVPRQTPHPRTVAAFTYPDNPVLGVFDPLAILTRLEKLQRGDVRTVFLDFYSNSQRGSELPETVEKVVDVVEAYLDHPVKGITTRLDLLRQLCVKWVGDSQAPALLDALWALYEALAYKAAALPRFSANTVGVSMRHINRPLVAIPELLTPDEERYFLPHVFNIHEDQARTDYLDLHGGRLRLGAMDLSDPNPRIPAAAAARSRLISVANQLEKTDGPAGSPADVFRRMGTALRIHACIIRSIGNFAATQVVRDRNKDRLTGDPRRPTKEGNWTGDPDLQLLHEFIRDELDNTAELIALLEHGGMRQVLTAADPALEDTFLLGPDLIPQLRQKIDIMRRHWLDAERYLAPPHK